MVHVRASGNRRSWCLCISLAVSIVVILAIVVPLAVILPKEKHHGKKSTVIVPLYMYPVSNTTWLPLYDALDAHPHLDFLVIINPSSGPGSSTYPDAYYAPELEKLHAYSNVEMVGYVRTGYATRNISTVISEVDQYAGWSSNSSSFAMSGIFFDEAPYNYSAAAVEYMATVNEAVRNNSGLTGGRTVIHNPGLIPDTRFTLSTTNITVVFEHDYNNFLTKLDASASDGGIKAQLSEHDRSKYCFLINSIPSDWSNSTLREFVDEISQRAEYLFVTSLTEGYYESWGGDWEAFTEVVPR